MWVSTSKRTVASITKVEGKLIFNYERKLRSTSKRNDEMKEVQRTAEKSKSKMEQ